MTIRAIPPSLDASVVARIDAMLGGMVREHGVTIPLAVESGSRAWGFPSPDSDYDCRFVFVRPEAQILSPWPQRDVIEAAADATLDVNGWDLGKALKLLVKGNAVIIEWLCSPIIYQGDPWFRGAFLDLAQQVANRSLIGRHYLHLGERQRRTYFSDEQDVPSKKIFYALRPAAALRWLRLHPGEAVAPMHFPTLIAQSDTPPEVSALAADLMARKALTRELGRERLPAPIARFIDLEFEAARAAFGDQVAETGGDRRAAAERFFRAAVARYDR